MVTHPELRVDAALINAANETLGRSVAVGTTRGSTNLTKTAQMMPCNFSLSPLWSMELAHELALELY